ncbi:unnamed protein product [Nippostrongylus brasiliensis]|uniref:Ribonucleases P/MRP protein subunit POP1 (inferred by orthology to a human protein) n=1 Tax=Nippostrongylus brasiliensis TaxID=27835 RepID=A0A0N4YHW7_NIPBR|nr:unnamed protein product [Nippostrongylus brasiliensis]
MDFWVALQMRTARASGWRDELTAHLEATRFCFPTDVIDATAGETEMKRMQLEHEYPFTFEYAELVNDWLTAKGHNRVEEPYVLRDRALLTSLSKWLQGKDKNLGQ